MKLITDDSIKTLVAEVIKNPKSLFKKNGKGEFAGLTQEQAAGIGLKVISETICTEMEKDQKAAMFRVLMALGNVSALRQEFEGTKDALGNPLLGKSEGGRKGLDAAELADKWSD